MKYRAVVVNPNADRRERPQQILGNEIESLVKWGEEKARDLPAEATVVIYQIKETAIWTRQGTKE